MPYNPSRYTESTEVIEGHITVTDAHRNHNQLKICIEPENEMDQDYSWDGAVKDSLKEITSRDYCLSTVKCSECRWFVLTFLVLKTRNHISGSQW